MGHEAGDVIPALPAPRIPVLGGGLFPVHRIYCVGRNFAEHAREMGVAAPERETRGQPVFFLKPPDAAVIDGQVPYPPGTEDLQHEVELVVAVGRDAPPGPISREQASALIFGYSVGLDLTRRDLQSQAKSKGLPWDTGKAFDYSAPVGTLVPAARTGDVSAFSLRLEINDEMRQHGQLADMIWDVADILGELSQLYRLRAGDLVFMGTPAGVAPLSPGDAFRASLLCPQSGELARLSGRIVTPITAGVA